MVAEAVATLGETTTGNKEVPLSRKILFLLVNPPVNQAVFIMLEGLI
jgi:hypothetical protein